MSLQWPSEVDGIFIGSGHNALVAAAYLGRAGCRTLVLESQATIGGGLLTEELTLPCFKHNLTAYFSRWTPAYPIWKDLDLGRFGFSATVPEVQMALPLADGGGLVTYHSLDQSLAAIKRFSPRDAATYGEVFPEFLTIVKSLIGPLRFAAPLPQDELTKLLRDRPLGRRLLELSERSPLELVCELFEHEVVRAMLLFNIATRAYLPLLETPGTGYMVLLAMVASHNTAIVMGGSSCAARALASAAYAAGSLLVNRAPVERVLVDNGRAVGVELRDGRQVRARRFVCSCLPAATTLGRLVDARHLDPDLRRAAVDEYHWHEDCLFGVHLALKEAPVYRDTQVSDDLNQALNHAIGYESSADFVRDMESIRRREVPAPPGIQVGVPTHFDPSQAPPGFATAFAWQFVPREPAQGGAKLWDGTASDELATAMLARWRDYAPNLGEAELSRALHTPRDTERMLPSMVLGDRHHGSYHPDNFDANRPHPLLSQYRSPIAGLYHCGSSTFPGGSFTGQPGYNAARAIAEDLGLELWWQPRTQREIVKAR